MPDDKKLYSDPSNTGKPTDGYPNQWTGNDAETPKSPEAKAEPFVYELVKKWGLLNRNAQSQAEKSKKNE